MNTQLKSILAKKLANKKKLNGFTLIELMVVIAIVGILSAVGLPELLKAQDSAKDSVAQQEAVAAAKTCSMDILTGGTAYADAQELDPKTWESVSGTCVAPAANGTIADTTLIGTGPRFKTTVVIENGVPGKPLKEEAS
jgi:type IV pilus assembly protein PilA